jgi:RNA methyltransferase, TrmH family
MEKISSFQNPKIRNLIKLHKAQERKEQKLFLVEGLKEIKMAIEAGYVMNELFWCPGLGISKPEIDKITGLNKSIYEISSEVFARIAYRDKSDGLMGVFCQNKLELNSLKPQKQSLIIILESVEKPGNLGAILRTADAASVFAILVCDLKTDIFNPNIIRSSIGCLFTNQVISCTNEEALKWLRKHEIIIYSSAIHENSKPYNNFDYSKESVAIVMGTEAEGLSEFWLKNCDEKIIIPMIGKIDSLNVSNSTAILVYEVMRQRNFMKKV